MAGPSYSTSYAAIGLPSGTTRTDVSPNAAVIDSAQYSPANQLASMNLSQSSGVSMKLSYNPYNMQLGAIQCYPGSWRPKVARLGWTRSDGGPNGGTATFYPWGQEQGR